ncbi:MAG TPA: hypothetical protein VGG46_14195 [Terriglobales bacterium]|jgi:hypothetical protein
MQLTLLIDAKSRPELFFWAGPIENKKLDSWLDQMQGIIPDDLKYLWRETGGGDFFESETIFYPFSSLYAYDRIADVNKYQHSLGLPENYLAFHSGIYLSVIETISQRFLLVDARTYKPIREFYSLEEWYMQGIRPEFENRYSLSPVHSKD